MSLSRQFAMAAVFALVSALPAIAYAQQKLKFAHVYETSEPYHKWALWAAQEIPRRTGNRYTMEVFPASQLGKETDINQSLSLGTIDVIYTGQAFAARTYPPLAIGGAPYMFRDLEHWKKFSDSPVLWDLAEVYLALQNKTVDAQENPLPTIEAKKFYEVQSHINLTGHITEMLLTIVSGQVWNKLTDADKKAFQDIFREAAAKATGEIVVSENKLVDEFVTKYRKTVVKSDRAAFKAVFTPFHLGPDATWDKALYDKRQAIK